MGQHTRVSERLGVAAEKSTKKSRSDELDKCKEKFEAFTKQFKPFIASLKTYHAAMVTLEQNRSEVSLPDEMLAIHHVSTLLTPSTYPFPAQMLEQIELLTKNTKLFDHAGKSNKVVKAVPAWAKTYSKKEHSYCSMERQMSALNNRYAEHVEQYCIDYVNEWEIVVTTRVEAAIAKAEELKKTWQHYEKKFQQLADNETKMTDKGKELAQSQKDKLKRNEEKLDVAKIDFDKAATTACHLIDSAVDSAWMEMTPIVYRLANMEMDRLGGNDSTALTESLASLVEKLKDFSKQHKINLTPPETKAKKTPPEDIVLKDPPKSSRSRSKSPHPTGQKPKRFWSKDK